MQEEIQPAMPPSEGVGDKIKSLNSSTVLWLLRIVNTINGIALIALYPIGFAFKIIEFTFISFWLCLYAIVFGLMLIVFELQCGFATSYIRENFGFLFSWVGRVLFLVFLGSLCFSNTEWLSIIIGICTFVNGIFNCWIVYSHPAFSYGGELYKTDATGKRPGVHVQSTPAVTQASLAPSATVQSDNPFAVGGGAPVNPSSTYVTQHAYGNNLPSDNPFDDV